MSFYIDASVIMPLFLVEATSEAVRSFFDTADEPIVVSEFAAAEFSSAVSRVSRTGEIEPAMADRHVMDFDVWREAFTTDVEIAPGDFRSATAIVRRFEFALRAPDALHLAICRPSDFTLVTLDGRMAPAAGPMGVKVMTP